ncbi:MAG TPA: sodium/glutamate symporter, partial [Turneriella sp.]|nr:sodium/glutamate symporter [Turneriella sp.]
MANFFLVLLFLGLAALVGKKVGWIHRYRIPPSLTGGLSLLLLFTFLPTYKTTDFFVHLKSLPSEFIALVFACFFLQKHDKAHSKRRSMRDVLAQTSMVWVAVMGQVLIGLVTTVFIFKPFFNEPLAFASVLETGFSGGHGTAVAMGPILAQNGIAAGLEYGLFSATIGLICGIVGGVWLIHHERRRMVKSESAMPESEGVSVDLHRLLVAALL